LPLRCSLRTGNVVKDELTKVPAAASGERLDAWLAHSLPDRSRAALASLIESGRVLVDGRPRPKGYRLKGGERVLVRPKAREDAAPAEPPEPRVVWENEDLVIVDKPPGLVVHPAPGHRGRTLVELLADRAAGTWQPLAVHRLDRDTSGLMIVAKHETARRELQRLIRDRHVRREYRALVEGTVSSRRGTIEAPLGRDPRNRTRMAVGGARPREARTRFEVERHLDAFTLVRVTLETGRTHQIRAHFAAIGHPICGDRVYGAERRRVEAIGLDRPFLHSSRLAFRYSGADETIEQVSDLPTDLARALRRAARGSGVPGG
jgi:23S rRNA pseudouridine1911/1915/1917 synthase